jgi:phosphopantothenate---cysteine ligase (CTP)
MVSDKGVFGCTFIRSLVTSLAMFPPAPQNLPRAVVTCGPGVAPIDAMRRITNFSSGELGVRLSECLLEFGWEVACFKSEASTYRDPAGANLFLGSFNTNEDLENQLRALPDPEGVHIVFHAAALTDYRVVSVCTHKGEPLHAQKIPSHYAGLQIFLEPAPKLLPGLQTLFPAARIVGWKFELDGDPASALEKGRNQLRDNGSSLCVVNGAALGFGFRILDPQGAQHSVQTRSELCNWLANWASRLILS